MYTKYTKFTVCTEYTVDIYTEYTVYIIHRAYSIHMHRYTKDIYTEHTVYTRGFNGSVNIPESCDLQSKFDPLNIICKPFSFNNFLSAYAF